MLMKWKDLLPGDKIKLNKEIYNRDDGRYVCEHYSGILIVIKVVERGSNFLVIDIETKNKKFGVFNIHGDIGNSLYICQDIPLFEVVELCDE